MDGFIRWMDSLDGWIRWMDLLDGWIHWMDGFIGWMDVMSRPDVGASGDVDPSAALAL